MVLDIRDLRQQVAPVAETSLDQLLHGEQAQLHGLVLSADDLEQLLTIAEDSGDNRRLAAIDILSQHRSWLSSLRLLRRIVRLAHKELDSRPAAALVQALRQCDEVAQFLTSKERAVAREAARGVPISRQTLAPITEALAGLPADIATVLLDKIRRTHPSMVPYAVDCLLKCDPNESLLRAFLAHLPQIPLFALLVEAGLPQTTTSTTRVWQRAARIAAEILQEAPSAKLLRHLLSKCGEDAAFARNHARFLHRITQRADTSSDDDLIGHFERLTSGASEDKIARLAQLLVGLSGRLDGQAGQQAAALLENWKSRSASLKLKIYHLEQGIR
ncbi:MAG: hypothetical protein J4F35_03270 [Candidatus Latescibacteria bacterium]|nr:hypothetical protein [Candidatus Latescibacterota bacterium]